MKRAMYWPGVLAAAVVFAVLPIASGQVILPPGVTGPPFLPDFDPALFDSSSTSIDNLYFPLAPGTVYTYRGEAPANGGTVTETSQVFVTFDTRNILGVETRVVRDTEYVNGLLAEDTFDWFAQDTAGNVWYFGESTTAFDEEGNPDTSGSWQAGVDGALPGFIMLASPTVGDHYYQEFYPGEAEDEAVVVALGLDIGDFSDVLQTYETTALEPDAREYKYYAPGLGLFLIEEDLNEQLMDPEFAVELVSVQVIPEPMSLSLAAIGVGGLAWIRRRLR